MYKLWLPLIAGAVVAFSPAWAQGEFERVNERIVARQAVDPMTDEDTSQLLIEPTDRPATANSAALAIQCADSEAGYEIYMDFDEYIAAQVDDMFGAQVRFDRGEVEQWIFISSASSEAGFVGPYLVDEFLEQLRASTQLAIRVMDHRGVQYTYVLRLEGLEEGLAYLACIE